MSDFKSKMQQIRFPQTPLRELTALPDPLAGIKGGASWHGGGTGRDGEREGKRMGRVEGGRKGEKGKGWSREGER